MILVDSDLLELDTSSAANIDVHCAFVDATLSTGVVINIGNQSTTISSATTTTILAAPTGATKVRRITFMSVRNRHATLSNDVIVVINTATDVEIFKTTLLAGESLCYSEALGFYVLKTARADRWMRLAGADVTNATTSFADITGLTCPVSNGKTYNFESHLYFTDNATTTGPRFGINGPTLTNILVNSFGRIVTLSAGVDAQVVNAQNAAAVTAVDTSVFGATLTGNISVTMTVISGQFTAGADGTFAMRSQSEIAVAAGVTIKVGSWLHVWEPTG